MGTLSFRRTLTRTGVYYRNSGPVNNTAARRRTYSGTGQTLRLNVYYYLMIVRNASPNSTSSAALNPEAVSEFVRDVYSWQVGKKALSRCVLLRI